MADPPDIALRRTLNRLGKNLAHARSNERKALGEIAAAAAKALDAGLTKAEVAERAGISRPTLDRILPK